MTKARENPEVHVHVVQKERGTLLGPFDCSAGLPHVHVSKFGVIPKAHQPGKWRLIVDLSAPSGKSVNDGIPADLCSLSYVRTEQVVQCILQLGSGAKMAKFNIKKCLSPYPSAPPRPPLAGNAMG